MKKIITMMFILLMSITVVSAAQEMDLSPDTIGIAPGDEGYVTVTVTKDGVVQPNKELKIEYTCSEESGDETICDAIDTPNPGDMSVTVTSPTDANGQATVTIRMSANPTTPKYHYKVVSIADSTGAWATVESSGALGTVLIPEFTTIGAAVVLLGAGLYSLKKRK